VCLEFENLEFQLPGNPGAKPSCPRISRNPEMDLAHMVLVFCRFGTRDLQRSVFLVFARHEIPMDETQNEQGNTCFAISRIAKVGSTSPVRLVVIVDDRMGTDKGW
jgi:hypothetical protein